MTLNFPSEHFAAHFARFVVEVMRGQAVHNGGTVVVICKTEEEEQSYELLVNYIKVGYAIRESEDFALIEAHKGTIF